MPGVIRYICEYKCHVNCLVIDFKIILIVKIGKSCGLGHALPDDAVTDKITYLNWRMREGGGYLQKCEISSQQGNGPALIITDQVSPGVLEYFLDTIL